MSLDVWPFGRRAEVNLADQTVEVVFHGLDIPSLVTYLKI